jgi:hypothetical protein
MNAGHACPEYSATIWMRTHPDRRVIDQEQTLQQDP